MPIAVRRDADPSTATVMALSTSSYRVGQGVAAALAVPVAHEVGWQAAMTPLAVPVVVALAAWLARVSRGRSSDATRVTLGEAARPLPRHRRGETGTGRPRVTLGVAARPLPPSDRAATPPAAREARASSVYRERDTWWLALFFGMQAALVYGASTWLPTMLETEVGVSGELAGTALSLFHLIGIAGTLAVPLLRRVTGSAVRAGYAVAGAWVVFFAGLVLAPDQWPAGTVVGGLTQGAGIGLGMPLIALRPADPAHGRGRSAAVQSAGYAIAAVGPVVLGWLLGVTGSWAAVWGVLLLGGVVMGVAARRAAADRPIGAAPRPT
ncbi:MAG: MFS transporter [Georgenia sp.]